MTVKISIGSDPEFIILDKHKELVPAFEFLSRDDCKDCNPCNTCKRKKENCPDACDDSCSECDICPHESPGSCRYCNECADRDDLCSAEIGTDACDDVGELRPTYADNPIDHHSNIQHLIEQIDTHGGYILRAGTFVKEESIGGHIHIGGFKQPPLGISDKTFENWMVHMRCMSDYLSLYAGIPLRKIEHPKDLENRGMYSSEYGFFGDMHHTDYGLEWRMPASWLVDSEIALSALSLAYTVASEYDINPEKVISGEHVEMKNLLRKKSVDSIIKKVEKMKLYRTYSHEIEPLFQLISEGKKWKDKNNFKDYW